MDWLAGIFGVCKSWLTKLLSLGSQWSNHFIRGRIRLEVAVYSRQMVGVLYDIGSSSQPYRGLFHHVDRYVGVDMQPCNGVDVVCDMMDLKIADQAADSVLCTQTLQYASDPCQMAAELARICKDGARCLLTAPFVAREEQRWNDYFRFSKRGLIHLMEQHEFVVEAIHPMGGFWLAAVYYTMFFFATHSSRLLRLLAIVVVPLLRLTYLLLRRFDTSEIHACNFTVLARRLPRSQAPR